MRKVPVLILTKLLQPPVTSNDLEQVDLDASIAVLTSALQVRGSSLSLGVGCFRLQPGEALAWILKIWFCIILRTRRGLMSNVLYVFLSSPIMDALVVHIAVWMTVEACSALAACDLSGMSG